MKKNKIHGLTTHGLSHTKPYRIWRSMKQRCYLKTAQAYPQYGARGISVCEKWMKFDGFYEDMGFPEKGMTLDRIDNDGNYCKENCRWVDMKIQCNNKRNNVHLTFKGETLTVAEWADRVNMKMPTIWARKKAGWPIEKILTPHRTRGF